MLREMQKHFRGYIGVHSRPFAVKSKPFGCGHAALRISLLFPVFGLLAPFSKIL